MTNTDTTLLDALLPQVAYEGWTLAAVRAALESLGRDPADAPLAFPNGGPEMVRAYWRLADARMLASAPPDLAVLRTPARIRALIAGRLQNERANREAIRRAFPRIPPLLPGTADAIWHAAGDTAADMSWYSKRAILTGVLAATLTYWLRDGSGHEAATLMFLDRRLADVARLGRLKPGSLLGQLRVQKAGVAPAV